MSELPKLTGRQREAAVERAGESIALTSGAGCGKTLVLARRFTELLMQTSGGDEESPFDRFVALTFTDKAAAEMAGRVREVLLDALGRSGDDEERKKLTDWITELPAAHISTIHSFCASLLRRHAVEAGIDPAFTVCADELLAAQMQTRAVEDTILKAVERADSDVLELLARAGMGRVAGDVKRLLARRIDWQEQDYHDPEKTLARWKKQQELSRRDELARVAADEKVRDELNYLAGYPCSDPADKLLAYREEKLGIITGILQQTDSITQEDFSSLKSPGNVGGRNAWGGAEAVKTYRRRLKAFVAKFAGLAMYFQPLGDADAEAARCLAALTKLARLADERYMREKRAAGMLDFDDLIDLTARLLREQPRVRKALRDRMDQLLIDECQDTDPAQLRMLWNLLADGRQPPSGKVIIIGDPKQSIYRFRGVRAEEFKRLCERFGKAQVVLDESFRAHRAGVAFVNEVFSRLMDDYEPIVSSRKEPPRPSVEILLAECDDGDEINAEAAAAAQADLVAQRVGEMIGREELVFDREAQKWRAVRPGDIAILFARMTNSLRYEHALQRLGVPYYIVGGVGFFQQQEVYDCLNALRVIDNPFDDIALFGLLRSAVFGLDDNVLLHIASASSPPYFDKLTDPAVLNRLTAPQRKQLRFACELLARLHRAKDALGAAALIERLLEQTGYAAVLLSQFHPAGRGGRRKLGNVLRLIDAARAAQATGRITLADFIRRYNEFVMDESRYEQAAVVGETDDVVRIMTIHKAKGLEFPVVIVPDLNAGFRGPRGQILFNPDWFVTYRPPGVAEENDEHERKEDPISSRLAKEAEKKALEAEDIRKLYVAATRHQDHLILVGADWRSKEGRFKDSGSYLAMLDEVLGISDALEAGREEIDYGKDFSARLARIKPVPPVPSRRTKPIGLHVISAAKDAEKVAQALEAAGKAGKQFEPPLVGPLLGPNLGGAIAATALADFDYCPMLYRWQHELRPSAGSGRPEVLEGCAPVPARPERKSAPEAETHLDAATEGSLFHRCMELVDFDAAAAGGAEALAAQADALVGRVVGEMELTVPAAPLADELAAMLARLAASPLMQQLTTAQQRLRELAFVYRIGKTVEITGRIDLLYQDAGGAWHVVDYKSDRVGPPKGQANEVETRAEGYELQMMIYLAAAGRHLGGNVADATVYFLRPGLSHHFAVSPEALAGVEERLTGVAAELIRSRRTGQFARRHDRACGACPYTALCLREGDG